MGLFSSSKSSSSTTNQQFDERVGAEGGSIVARDEGFISLDTPEAFETANKSLEFGESTIQIVANTIESSLDKVLGSVESSNNRVQQSALDSLTFADNFTRSESANLTNSLISMFPWVVGGLVAVVYLKNR